MGWFWADAPAAAPAAPPNKPLSPPKDNRPPPSCPMNKPAPKAEAPSACPMNPPTGASDEKLNPLNLMPNLPQTRHASQKVDLPTERTISSIPKGEEATEGKWEYPSPQQMYNALIRKGHDQTPEDAVEAMVAVHNFLNEGAWGEIKTWEHRWSNGLWEGLKASFTGEHTPQEDTHDPEGEPRLLRFQGRSQDPTPKSQILQLVGKVFPKRATPPPFDRHDWFVKRKDGEVRRYVIDYYSGGLENDLPVFFLDVRPAIDSVGQGIERIGMWGGGVWRNLKATGAGAKAAESKKDE
ncbi:cytochrome c and c1 heme-lyase [Ascobolus immersus RN42]|uniref:Holocytochrome c-type synthase n=1 Tax=Ascobolus immersus RN42 TaxID=1160509 RepID=A0A3N4HMR4_ASCIM|nr:cytochrome c and c1 heme-lyase [Ascobolus immersus RN42]